MLIMADTCRILERLPIEQQKVTGQFPITHRTLVYVGLSHI